MLRFKKLKVAHLRLGQRGEKYAETYLRDAGLDILVKNYRGKRGEIDIVCRDGNSLCFIEVKTRHKSYYSRPANAVTWKKRGKIAKTAKEYLRELGTPHVLFRFDIVEVYFIKGRLADIKYLPRAFTEVLKD